MIYLIIAPMTAAFNGSILNDIADERPPQGVLTSCDHLVYTPAIIETKDNHFSAMRRWLSWIIAPPSLLAAGLGLLWPTVTPTVKNPVKSDKHNILLKLRI
jgi:hypothetical protein